MISSIFERTNPINFIILGVFISFFLIGGYFFYLDAPFNQGVIFNLIESIIVVIISLFLVDFINRKNSLTKSNSYTILLFVLLFCLFPKIFNQLNLLLANLFILLSFRRLVSIRSNRDIEIKIFDASLWVFVATYFYSWSLLFIIMVYAGIFLYKKNDYRNLLIPLTALFTVLIITFTYYYLTEDLDKFFSLLQFSPKFVIEKFENIKYTVPFVFVCVMGGWCSLFFFVKKQSKSFVTRVPGILVMLMLIIGIIIAILSETANTSELIFWIFPLSVIIARYVENLKRVWIKELILWSFILLPFIVLFL
ncbi:hypothetical protein JM658_02255 [Joostella atrarenae]|uniref:Beta-carotene 15,15'-monooxygenase n=1 Tax=Joostella atrarenae TaxID=679257 RepID=A0ABS9IZN2_9FLAO|nr:DUF6427 family protein [Joostella atrarenae]MCF8713636.1 hypothetical protein [Joostella atrarenae]